MGQPTGETQEVVIRGGTHSFPAKVATLPLFLLLVGCLISLGIFPSSPAKEHPLGPGITKEFSATQDDLLQALHEVLEDQTIHGTWIYDKQPVLTGAIVVDSTPLFEPWNQTGKVFYKIRKEAIAPRHFLE